jgi:hypothetical protein
MRLIPLQPYLWHLFAAKLFAELFLKLKMLGLFGEL